MLYLCVPHLWFFFFSSRRRHTRLTCDWSSDVCSSDLEIGDVGGEDDRALVLVAAVDGGVEVLEHPLRSGERRVGEEGRSWWWGDHFKKKKKLGGFRGLRWCQVGQRGIWV